MFPEFVHPWWLLLLAGLPVIGWRLAKKKTAALRFSDVRIIERLGTGSRPSFRFVGIGSRLLVLLLLILALATPRWTVAETRLPAEAISIGIVLDVSGSMAEADYIWDGLALRRVDAVKKVFRLFVEGGQDNSGNQFPGRGNDLIMLTAFASRPNIACPLTLSHDALLKILEVQEPRVGPVDGSTNIGDALALTLAKLKTSGQGDKVILLFTDGEQNIPPPALSPRQAAQLAGNLHIPIYVIDAGQETDTVTVENGQASNRKKAQQILEDVAKLSGGRYFEVRDTSSLLSIIAEIDQLTRARIDSLAYRDYYDGTLLFGLIATGILLVVLILETTFLAKGP